MHISYNKIRIKELGFGNITLHYLLIDIIDDSGYIDFQTVGTIGIVEHDDTKILLTKQHRICAVTVITVKKGSGMTDSERIQCLDGTDKSASPPI